MVTCMVPCRIWRSCWVSAAFDISDKRENTREKTSPENTLAKKSICVKERGNLETCYAVAVKFSDPAVQYVRLTLSIHVRS